MAYKALGASAALATFLITTVLFGPVIGLICGLAALTLALSTPYSNNGGLPPVVIAPAPTLRWWSSPSWFVRPAVRTTHTHHFAPPPPAVHPRSVFVDGPPSRPAGSFTVHNNPPIPRNVRVVRGR